MPTISKITIGRLYNLGNYEHVRYEVTVDVPSGQSAAKAVKGLERVIAGVAPIKGVKSESELSRDAEYIERISKLTGEEWDREFRQAVGTRAQIIRRYKTALKDDRRKRKEAVARATKARHLFDDLCGAVKWTDAKLEWDDESDWS